MNIFITCYNGAVFQGRSGSLLRLTDGEVSRSLGPRLRTRCEDLD